MITNFPIKKGWGNSWGMFVETNVTLEDLRKHFRKFLLVKTEDGKELYFRFYDPRVLRIFLPTCDEHQLKDFFGPVQMFAMESEDPECAIQFELENGKLISKKIIKQNFWNKLNGIVGTDISENNIDSKAETNQPDQNKNKPNRKWNFLID